MLIGLAAASFLVFLANVNIYDEWGRKRLSRCQHGQATHLVSPSPAHITQIKPAIGFNVCVSIFVVVYYVWDLLRVVWFISL